MLLSPLPAHQVPAYSGPVYIGRETDSGLRQNAILKWQVLRRVIDVRRDRSRNSSPGTTFVVEPKGSNAEGEPFNSKLLDV